VDPEKPDQKTNDRVLQGDEFAIFNHAVACFAESVFSGALDVDYALESLLF